MSRKSIKRSVLIATAVSTIAIANSGYGWGPSYLDNMGNTNIEPPGRKWYLDSKGHSRPITDGDKRHNNIKIAKRHAKNKNAKKARKKNRK